MVQYDQLAPRHVPWACHDEWRFVAACLFGGDARALARGMRVVEMWCVRGDVPPAVESTVALLGLRAQLVAARASEDGDEGVGASERDLRLALSCAIIRLVNEVVDAHQQGAYALSVSLLAEKARLPRILVDLRHGATHDVLPPLEVLAHAADLALDWLLANYWDVQGNYEADVAATCKGALQRYTAALTGPACRPAEGLALQLASEVRHVKYARNVQRILLDAIITDASLKVALILPITRQMATYSETFLPTLIEYAIECDGDAARRAVAAVQDALPAVKKTAVLAACARNCMRCPTESSSRLLALILAAHGATLPPSLAALIRAFLPPPAARSAPARRRARTQAQLLKEAERLLGAACVPCDGAHGLPAWRPIENWRRTPMGVTQQFDPLADFRLLFTFADS